MEISYPSIFFDEREIWWRKQSDDHPVSYTYGIDGYDFHFINSRIYVDKGNECLSAASLANHLLHVSRKKKDLKAKQSQQPRKKEFTDLPLELQDIIFELATSLLFISCCIPGTYTLKTDGPRPGRPYIYWVNELFVLKESDVSDPCRMICNTISKACPLTYVNRRANLSVLRRLHKLFEARDQWCREERGGAFRWMLNQLDVTARFNADLAIEASLWTMLQWGSTTAEIAYFPLPWAFDNAATTVEDVIGKGFRLPEALCFVVNRIHLEWDLENDESLGMPTRLLGNILGELDWASSITISLRPCLSPRDHESDKRVVQELLAQRIGTIRLKDRTYLKVG